MACFNISPGAGESAGAAPPRVAQARGRDWSLEPARLRVSRAAAALAMGSAGGVGAAATLLAVQGVEGVAIEALATTIAMAVAAAGLTGAFVMRWFAERTQFGWGAAAFGGAVTAFISFTPFTLLLIVAIAVEEWWIRGAFHSDLLGLVRVFAAGAVVAPFALSPIIAPIGALGGILCRFLAIRR